MTNLSSVNRAWNVQLELAQPYPSSSSWDWINPVGVHQAPYVINPSGTQTFYACIGSSTVSGPANYVINAYGTNAQSPLIQTALNTLMGVWHSSWTPNFKLSIDTPTHNYVLHTNGVNGTNTFVVTAINVGSTRTVTYSADGDIGIGATQPISLAVCETTDGVNCLAPFTSSFSETFTAGTTKKFIVRVTALGTSVMQDVYYARIMFRLYTGAAVQQSNMIGSISTAWTTN